MTRAASLKVKIQKFGTFLSGMVMPNIGVFIAWGILTALFIDTGWLPNEDLNHLVGPTLKYLMPVLIGYTGGTMVHGRRGGAVGALATMGVVIGADITMLIGGMVMGPLGALVMKWVDRLLAGRVKAGMEMLADNFSMGIVGAILMVLGYVAIEPIFGAILSVLTVGVTFLVDANILPFTSIFVQPAQILFLNNAINHGVMIPIGVEQAAAAGKSILFLVEANGGVWTGAVLAFALFGSGMAKKSAPAATFIMFLGGIAEVCFPYVLSKPKTILGPIAGNIAGLFTLSALGGGTVAAVSPGSFLAMLAMTPKGAFFANIAGYFVALAVTCAVTGFFLIRDRAREDENQNDAPPDDAASGQSARPPTPDAIKTAAPAGIKKIIFACDAGMGSSVMGVSMMKAKLSEAMLNIDIEHSAVKDIPESADAVITSRSLEDRVKSTIAKHSKAIPVFGMTNLLSHDEYDQIIVRLKSYNGETALEKAMFSEENIVLNAACKDKREAIRACGRILVDRGYVAEAYIDDMLVREEIASVYVGNHLAIPHGTANSERHIIASGISFLQVPDGVAFGGEVAYMLIGIAGKDGKHLQMLSGVAAICSDLDHVQKLRAADDKKVVYDILANIRVVD